MSVDSTVEDEEGKRESVKSTDNQTTCRRENDRKMSEGCFERKQGQEGG